MMASKQKSGFYIVVVCWATFSTRPAGLMSELHCTRLRI